eukprot:g4811.t1
MEDTSTKAFIYKARFQNSLHVKAAEARYNEIGRLAEQKKEREKENRLRAQRAREQKLKESKNDQDQLYALKAKGEIRMTTEVLNLVSLKASNNRLATDMKKYQKQIALIDDQLVKLSATLYTLKTLNLKQLKQTQNAGYPRKIEKMKRQVEQLRGKMSIGKLTNKELRNGIDQKRLELKNLNEGFNNIREDLDEKSNLLFHLKHEIESNIEDFEEAEEKGSKLYAEMKKINKSFRENYEKQIAIFEKQYAEELAEERKYETVLLDSPTSKNKRGSSRSPGSPGSPKSKWKAAGGNTLQKVSNNFFGASKHKGTLLKAVRLNRLDDIKNKVNSLEEAFETMTRETGIEDTNELVDTIIESDRQNFRVMQQLNELNRDIEEYEVENKNIRRAIRLAVAQERSRKKGRVVHIDRVRDRVTQTQQKVIDENNALESRRKSMYALEPHLLKLFSILGCDELSARIDNGVNEMNIMPLLGSIEQRIVDLANVCNNLNDRKERRNTSGTYSDQHNNSRRGLENGNASLFLTQSLDRSNRGRFSPFGSVTKPRHLPNIEDMNNLAQEVKANDLNNSNRTRGRAPSPIYSIKTLKEEAIAVVKMQEANANRIADAIERAALEDVGEKDPTYSNSDYSSTKKKVPSRPQNSNNKYNGSKRRSNKNRKSSPMKTSKNRGF